MFYGRSFIFDNVPSEIYGLYISSLDNSGAESSDGSSSMDIIEKKIFRRPSPFFLGATPSPVLTFKLSAFFDGEMDAVHFEAVQKWLFSRREYTRFAVDQPDVQDVYWNCLLIDPTIERVGNLIRGFTCTVRCDSPYGWKYPKTTIYEYTATSVDATEIFYNTSDDDGSYLYPNLVITQNNTDGDISITVTEDSNRVFSFMDLQANEVLTVDCLNQTISSSTGLKRMGNFNKNFLRLVPGKNTLEIVGNVESIAMETQFVARKIGG